MPKQRVWGGFVCQLVRISNDEPDVAVSWMTWILCCLGPAIRAAQRLAIRALKSSFLALRWWQVAC